MAEWIRPVAGPIGAGFGKRVAPLPGGSTNHLGVDIGANNGSPVVAQKAGRVAFAGLAGGFGGLVRVDHDGPDETYAAHMSYISVRYGQYVVQGQALGASGGRRGQWGAGTSTGSHCHVEHRINGIAVDPITYWSLAPAGGDSIPIEIEKEEDTHMRYIYRTSDGSQAIIGGLTWLDYGDGNRAEITARQLCPDQVVNGKAVPAPLSAHEFQINFESYQLRMAAARRDLGISASPAVDPAAIAAALAPLLKTSGATGITVADIEAALADDFASIPAAVRARIIKE